MTLGWVIHWKAALQFWVPSHSHFDSAWAWQIWRWVFTSPNIHGESKLKESVCHPGNTAANIRNWQCVQYHVICCTYPKGIKANSGLKTVSDDKFTSAFSATSLYLLQNTILLHYQRDSDQHRTDCISHSERGALKPALPSSAPLEASEEDDLDFLCGESSHSILVLAFLFFDLISFLLYVKQHNIEANFFNLFYKKNSTN